MKFKVMTFIYETHADKRRDQAYRLRKYVSVKTGMTWMAAKAMRKTNKDFTIAPDKQP